MNKQLGKKILLVLAAVMVMILLSSFKMQNEGDRSFKKIVLNKNKSVEYTVDVGKMGLLKYWLEPNVFSVALRCQTEDDTLKLRCETEGVDAIISQGSKKGIWKKLKSEDVLVKRSKNTVPINLEIAVPSKNIYRRNVQEGKIKNGRRLQMDIMIFLGCILLLVLFVVVAVVTSMLGTIGAIVAEEDDEE